METAVEILGGKYHYYTRRWIYTIVYNINMETAVEILWEVPLLYTKVYL